MTPVIANPAVGQSPFGALAEALHSNGWCIVPGFLGRQLTTALREEAEQLRAQKRFRAAAVGHAATRHLDSAIRGDEICWIDVPASSAQEQFLSRMEGLRRALNAQLYLGLFDLECHFSFYPPGACYHRHLDRFRDDSRRTVSCVVYLNDDWAPAHGGQLRLYQPMLTRSAAPAAPTGVQGVAIETPVVADVYPIGGTLACFLSAAVPHEVLPATRARLALTGWFRTRS